jgi:hypothetical protein
MQQVNQRACLVGESGCFSFVVSMHIRVGHRLQRSWSKLLRGMTRLGGHQVQTHRLLPVSLVMEPFQHPRCSKKYCIPLATELHYYPNMDDVSMDPPKTEVEVLNRGIAMLRERLPGGWTLGALSRSTGRRVPDGVVELTNTDGRAATLLLEANRIVEGRDVETLRDRLEEFTDSVPGGYGLVLARYLSPSVRARLRDAGLSYVDATGNVRVIINSPGLFLSDRGADSDPWRGPGRPLGTLRGEPAAKVVRALIDFEGPWTMRGLIEKAKASTGATYRVIEFLEREGLAARTTNGMIRANDWVELLRSWSREYEFARTNQITRWIAPRGLAGLSSRIVSSESSLRYAVSGSLAAKQWAAYAPARLAMMYVENAVAAADAWGLSPADAGTNVLLGEAKFDVVFDRTHRDDSGLVLAAPSQVAVDMMTGPGRNPNEAEELLDWMRRNERSWRLRN